MEVEISKNDQTIRATAPYSLLTTKLYVPPLHPSSVKRPRLVKRLSEGMKRKLTLISAPAGFGKTTLLSEWIHQSQIPVAWFSIDKADNDEVSFLTYIIAALEVIEARVGQTALNLLRSPHPPPMGTILIHLLNDLTPLQNDFVLVLDDYHLIDIEPVHNIIEFILSHLPPQMRLVISTRSDAPLSLARLRSQNQLLEIRAADLCFTTDEISLFLNQKLNLGLSVDEIATLESRTEGWIAGLQLAALSMQGDTDTSRFIRAFGADNRYIVDYLVEEALSRQPERVQDFLRQTAILDRLSGPLCDAVTQRNGGQEMLNVLEKANLFIFPLDHERGWFRYHRLFADLLRQRLHHAQGDLVPELHRRAGEWCAQNELKDEAVHHALAAHHFEEAAHLIEESAEILWDRGLQTKQLRWFEELPDELVSKRPLCCVFHAAALVANGNYDAAELRLQEASDALDSAPDESPSHPIERRRLSKVEQYGRIATIRAMISTFRGDIPGMIEHSRQALHSLQERDLTWRGVAAITSGMAHGWAGDGDLEKARQAFSEAAAVSMAGKNVHLNLFARVYLATIEALQGRLKDAKASFEELLQLADENSMSQTGTAGSIHASLGGILCEMNELDAGIDLIEKGIQFAGLNYDCICLGACRLNLAKALLFKGDVAGARDMIQKIEESKSDFELPPWMRYAVSALKAQIWLAVGDMDAALRWVDAQRLNVDDELNYPREYEYLAFARILIAQNRLDDADRLLKRLIHNAEVANRFAMAIEMRLLNTLTLYEKGDIASALDELERALPLAEPGGYISSFVAGGAPIADLLERIREEWKAHPSHSKGRFSKAYVKKLLLAFKTSTPPKTDHDLVELLSEREREVLYLIAAGLSNPEISGKLFISLNTVRTHTKHINRKLNVHSRTQAIVRAKALGLL